MIFFRILSQIPGYDSVVSAAEKIGIQGAILIAIILFLLWLVRWAFKQLIQGKNDEIARLEKTNNELEERLLKYIDSKLP